MKRLVFLFVVLVSSAAFTPAPDSKPWWPVCFHPHSDFHDGMTDPSEMTCSDGVDPLNSDYAGTMTGCALHELDYHLAFPGGTLEWLSYTLGEAMEVCAEYIPPSFARGGMDTAEVRRRAAFDRLRAKWDSL